MSTTRIANQDGFDITIVTLGKDIQITVVPSGSPSPKKKNSTELTPRQKYLARSVCPTADGDCTMKQVSEWRMKLAGTVYDDRMDYQFVAINKNGKMKNFDYCHGPTEARKQDCNCASTNDDFNYYVVKKKAHSFAERS